MDRILLEFSVPVVDKNLTSVEADPFDIMIKKENSTCRIKYEGPKAAIISNDEDCVYATHVNSGYSESLSLAASLKCNNRSSFGEGDYYKIEKCTVSKSSDEKDFVQAKIYDNKYFMYCPGLNYEIQLEKGK